MLSAYLLRKKSICFFQTSISKAKWKRLVLFKLLKRVDQLVGITDLHTIDYPDKVKISTIPNCFSYKGLTSNINLIDQLNLSGNKVVLFMGGICETKGTKNFVEIALELLKLRSDLCFVIAGSYHKSFVTSLSIGENDAEFNYNKDVFDLIGSLIDTKFKFLGEINYVNDVLKQSDILISTNTYPHFSRPIVEAWANNIPVVSNEDVFTKHMCHNRESILLIDINQIEKSAQKINDFLNDQKKIVTHKIEGFNNYKAFYSQEVVNQALEKLFKTIV